MSLIVPTCPACGTEAEHRPQEPAAVGAYRAYISHDHGCEVSRYYTWIHPDGTHSSHPMPDNVSFERFARAKPRAS